MNNQIYNLEATDIEIGLREVRRIDEHNQVLFKTWEKRFERMDELEQLMNQELSKKRWRVFE